MLERFCNDLARWGHAEGTKSKARRDFNSRHRGKSVTIKEDESEDSHLSAFPGGAMSTTYVLGCNSLSGGG